MEEDFNPGEYHPAFHHPPAHDHHRRARHAAFWGSISLVIGGVLLYWAAQTVWGEGQRDIGRIVGWVLTAGGVGLLVFAAVAFFVLDDDARPELPEE